MLPLRQWFLATVAILFLCTSFAAEPIVLGENVRLLSYSQLMNLTPAKREQYLLNLRSLLVEISERAQKNKNGFALEEIRELNEYFALLQALLPEAHAKNRQVLVVPDEVVPTYIGTQKNGLDAWECFAREPLPDSVRGYDLSTRQRLDQGKDSPSQYIGFHTGGSRTNQGRDQLQEFMPGMAAQIDRNNEIYLERKKYLNRRTDRVRFNYGIGTCVHKSPPPVNRSTGKPDCEMLPDIKGKYWKVGYVKNPRTNRILTFCVPQSSWYSLHPVRRENLSNPQGGQFIAEVFRHGGRVNKHMNMYVKGGTVKLPQPTLAEVRGAGSADQKDKPKRADAPGQTSEKPKSVATNDRGSGSQERVVQASGESTKTTAEPTAAVAGSTNEAGSCVFRVTDCSSIDTEAARNEFFASSESENMDCIFAGNISSYIDNDKRPGRCQAVYKFSYSSNKNELSCGSYKKIVCNPMVFGVQKDGSPYCVPAKSHATRECNEASTAETRMPDFLNQDIDGLKETWDAFAEGFNRVCRNRIRRTYFCEECNVMMSRIHEMNQLALGITDCGAAKPFDTSVQQAPAEERTSAAPAERAQ